MPRIKIELPPDFPFSTIISIRITDLNYGNHVGNDSFLSLIHEARVQYLRHCGLHELKFEGTSLIMSDVGIEFKAELFYGDEVKAYVAAGNFSRAGFDFFYKLVNAADNSLVALAKTGMVCFDYNSRRIVSIPDAARQKLS
jgi:acyl-CoA thioesterase FadM